MTKEELLQKGISEKDADIIISALESNPETSLQALEKALGVNLDTSQDMQKAKKEGDEPDKGKDDDDDDDGYNEEYMKKHMKRYMKEGKKSSGRMAKEGEEMEKAIGEVDTDTDAAIIETTDLKPFLSNQSKFNVEMAKAVSGAFDQIETITAKVNETFELMRKAATVQVEMSKNFNKILTAPNGRKGMIAPNVNMQKAVEGKNDKDIIWDVLNKAVKNKDQKAGQIISMFESSGRNIDALPAESKVYINDLLTEAK